jgi:hypothetical protein
MQILPLQSEKEYENMLEWVDNQFDNLPDPNTENGR